MRRPLDASASACRRSASRRAPGRRTPSSTQHLGDQHLDAVEVAVACRPARRGRSTMKAWPMRGRLPSSTKKLEASKPKLRADQRGDQQLDHQRQHRALGLRDGADRQHRALQCRPSGRWSGWPSASSAQPSGMRLAFLGRDHQLAARHLADRLRSIISGSASRRGNDRRHRVGAEDRVLAAGRRHGRRRVGEAQADHAGSGRRRAGDRRPRRSGGCWSRRQRHTPCSRAAAMASRTASSQAGKARPSLRVDQQRRRPCGAARRGSAAPSTRPLRRCVAYCAHAAQAVRAQALRFGAAPARARCLAPSRRWRRRAAARAATSACSFVDGSELHASASSTLSAIRKRHALVRLGGDAGDVRRQQQVRAVLRSAARPAAARRRTRRSPRRRDGRSSAPRPAPPRRRCRRARC